MKTIVALVDFSDVTSKVLAYTETLAKALDSRVVILHIVQGGFVFVGEYGPASPTLIEERERSIRADRAKLLDAQGSLAKSGLEVMSRQLEDATMEKILDESRRFGADLMIVGSHHHSTLYEIFIGSFTHDLLKRASCPVLVVPAETEIST